MQLYFFTVRDIRDNSSKLKIPAVRFKSNGTDHFGCVRPEYLGPPLKTTFNLMLQYASGHSTLRACGEQTELTQRRLQQALSFFFVGDTVSEWPWSGYSLYDWPDWHNKGQKVCKRQFKRPVQSTWFPLSGMGIWSLIKAFLLPVRRFRIA